MKLNQYTKVIMYISIDSPKLVRNMVTKRFKSSLMLLETSQVVRVRQTGFRDAKSKVEVVRAKGCPKDLGGQL